jgi:hypothetical protein
MYVCIYIYIYIYTIYANICFIYADCLLLDYVLANFQLCRFVVVQRLGRGHTVS